MENEQGADGRPGALPRGGRWRPVALVAAAGAIVLFRSATGCVRAREFTEDGSSSPEAEPDELQSDDTADDALSDDKKDDGAGKGNGQAGDTQAGSGGEGGGKHADPDDDADDDATDDDANDDDANDDDANDDDADDDATNDATNDDGVDDDGVGDDDADDDATDDGADDDGADDDDRPQCEPPCAEGATCTDGQCLCREGEVVCDDTCVDLLTDPDHCGACSNTCEDGCSAGNCFLQVVEGPLGTVRLAVDATDIYYTQQDLGTVSRVNRRGVGDRVLAASQARPAGIAVDENYVYWANQAVSPTPGQIMKMVLSGGTPIELAGSEGSPHALALDATHVYWSNDEYGGEVAKVPVDGGEKTVLYPGDDDWATTALAIDETHAYWLNYGQVGGPEKNARVMSVPLEGGVVAAIAEGLDSPWALAVHDGQVYFSTPGAVTGVYRVSTTGGAVTKLSDPQQCYALAADETGLYAGGGGEWGKTLMRLSPDGSTSTALSTEPSPSAAILLDPTTLLWASSTGGIRSMPKPP